MTIAEWCVFGTLMLYLLTIAASQMGRAPRISTTPSRAIPISTSDPIRARALGAHQNGIEAFPFFAAAVLLAEFRLGPQRLIDELAVLFLIVRIAYVFTYLGNRPTLRSILWRSALRSTSRSSSCLRSGITCRPEAAVQAPHKKKPGAKAGLSLSIRRSRRYRTPIAPNL